ncbi:23S rRNA pseudouridine1911/1915/1917 synthase [Cerasibacillus quisquiliarum]|uniref:Pseudouridine synthase n=1 Tax=Cerasibacillus quisquiliarum TaxID=227865 RepID=A0A511UZX8_9BACI|nr:RluA family pseudouridine synthase [Cerasibacillus quisquiliarum]MBB5146327.1 23S rRNA pseudouridine1911/1915/1917 synthase [Cerasibacillus quisquiliarum]GEN30652.1 putative RNA pseudouridine synthase YjbO [Cerasibacillus quisquiliarum]
MINMEWTIQSTCHGMTIGTYLKTEKQFSRRILKAVKFDGGKILLNGEEKTVRAVLKAGDKLSVTLPIEKNNTIIATPMPLDIIYEDDALMVINKQAGVASIPSMHHPDTSIANGVIAYYKEKKLPYTVHIVTRLDVNTSGLLLIAKHRYIHSLLAKMQQKGNIKRRYHAIVEGILEEKKGTINQPIGRKEDSIIERTVRSDGQRAVTHYEVVWEKDSYSLINIVIETGRTHQIRVHMSYLGCPIVGDDLYGGSTCERHALHCSELSFLHPISNKHLVFQSSIPSDMLGLTEKT